MCLCTCTALSVSGHQGEGQMKSNLIKWLVALNLLVLAGYVSKRTYTNHQKNAVVEQRYAKAGQSFARAGILTEQEWATFCNISDHLKNAKEFSDDDLEWVVAAVRSSLQDNTPKGVARRASLTLCVFAAQKRTPVQQDKLFDLATALVGTGTDTDKGSAAFIFARIADKRSIPYLLPLQSSTNRTARELATRTLRRLGYQQAKAH